MTQVKKKEKTSFMLKFGMRYFKKIAKKYPDYVLDDEIHVLNVNERRKLRYIERKAVFLAALAGALSATCSAIANYFAQPIIANDNSLEAQVYYWSIVGGVTMIATAFELYFLYVDSIRAVHKLSYVAGISILKDGKEDEAIIASLVKAALEIPNPKHSNVLEVNPLRETPKMKVIFVTIIYKLKLTVSNLIVKTIFRRIIGKASARWIDFVAVPITAFWNAIVCWWIIREARFRVMGPSAVEEFLSIILDKPESEYSETFQTQAFAAIGSCIVRSRDLHPNLVVLLKRLHTLFGETSAPIDDSRMFFENFQYLSRPEQQIILKLLSIGIVIDGKIATRERKLFEEICQNYSFPFDRNILNKLRHLFVSGEDYNKTIFNALFA